MQNLLNQKKKHQQSTLFNFKLSIIMITISFNSVIWWEQLNIFKENYRYNWLTNHLTINNTNDQLTFYTDKIAILINELNCLIKLTQQ